MIGKIKGLAMRLEEYVVDNGGGSLLKLHFIIHQQNLCARSVKFRDAMDIVVVDPTPPTCCQQSPAPESCGSQQSLPPGGKERLHFVGIRPEVQARKGGW